MDIDLGSWARRRLERRARKLAARRAAKPKDDEAEDRDEAEGEDEDTDALVAEAAEKVKAGKGDKKLMKLAKGVDPKHNPPTWVADEAIWEKAKKAVEESPSEPEDFYAVVTHVYQNMGGTIKGK